MGEKKDKGVKGTLTFSGRTEDPEGVFAELDAIRQLPKPKLKISVIAARNLKKADTFGKSDPFCEIFIQGAKVAETAVVKKNLNPTWNYSAQLDLPVDGPAGVAVRVECYDKDNLSKGAFLGEVVMPDLA